MESLLLDTALIIHNLLSTHSQINLRLVSTHFAHNFPITNLYDTFNSSRLTNEILKSYRHVIKLSLLSNSKVTDIDHMTKLQLLSASNSSVIGDDNLKNQTNMVILYISDNRRITNVNHMRQLLELRASSHIYYKDRASGITNAGIADLRNLIILYANNNDKITDINHLTKLRELYARGACGIGYDGMAKLNELTVVRAEGNERLLAT